MGQPPTGADEAKSSSACHEGLVDLEPIDVIHLPSAPSNACRIAGSGPRPKNPGRRVARCDRPVRTECWLELGQRIGGRVRPRRFVGRKVRAALRCLDREWLDLVPEVPGYLRGHEALLALHTTRRNLRWRCGPGNRSRCLGSWQGSSGV